MANESKLVIVIDAPMPARQAERLRALSPRIELVEGVSAESLARAEVIYTSPARFEPDQCPRLRWVQTNSVTIAHLADRPIARSPVPVSNVRGAYCLSVAECALSMLLALTRRLPQCEALQRESRWPSEYPPLGGENCFGKTMALAGYGSTGRHLARIAQAMGMRVLASKRNPERRAAVNEFCFPGAGDPEGLIPERLFGPAETGEMFAQADFAVVTLPLTPEARGSIGRRVLESLPGHAYLVDVGRGGVIEEAALVEHLRAGRIAGAALDVFATEPLPPESPLWSMPNVLIVPHLGSYTRNQAELATEVLIENVSRDLEGRPLLNRVDFRLGY